MRINYLFEDERFIGIEILEGETEVPGYHFDKKGRLMADNDQEKDGSEIFGNVGKAGKSVLDGIPVVEGIKPITLKPGSSIKRPKKHIGNCKQCGGPIYGPEFIYDEFEPGDIVYSCLCKA